MNWQQIHQAYGRPYQLPQSTAHNETCANIGNMLFNWRMLQATGDAKYADIVEVCLYNSILTGISLDGTKYLYTNPLRLSDELPYKLRWSRERKALISCFCCPPNTLRTLCEAQEYAYSLAKARVDAKGKKLPGALYVNLYGENNLNAVLNGKAFIVSQKTDYPFDGRVELTIDAVGKKCLEAINLRVPEWCENAKVVINGEEQQVEVKPNTYITLNRQWKKGDKITLDMEMRVRLIESHPLVEESRNQVAVKRGPIVYCLEQQDVNANIDNVVIPADINLVPVDMVIDGSKMKALEGTAKLIEDSSWKNTLYREVGKSDKTVKIRLIPHYAYGNRGMQDMTVWMPLSR
mgnify:FL=1